MNNEVEYIYTGGDGQRDEPVAPENVTHVTIDPSVTVIGEYAFDECTSLVSVIIPTSVKTIGAATFGSCTSLVSVIIPTVPNSKKIHHSSRGPNISSIVLAADPKAKY